MACGQAGGPLGSNRLTAAVAIVACITKPPLNGYFR